MADPSISAQFLRHVANCVELTGRAPDGLLADIGLTRGELDDPERLIRLADFLSFFEHAAVLAANPHFGLHAGRLAGSDSLGPLSFLFLSAPTLRQAFASFTRYLGTMQQASRNAFREGARWATFEYRVLDEALTRRRQDAEYSLGATYSLARQFTAGALTLSDVRFEHEMVGDYARYRDYFGCEVFFDQPGNSFSFEVAFLDLAGKALSPALHPIIEDHLRHRAHGTEPAGRVVGQINALLAAAPSDAPPSLNDVARSLGLSPASLARQLKARDTSWRTLLTQHRMAIAARLLRQGRRDIADIALAVGYAESASFIRAFARHFGTTPLRYRNGVVEA